ncbi:SDR family NAD(P)-dependent oxidoreductase [Nesterenkonia cremea]|uniref:SDR family NAD(P)-dependent oxidoreductase n=1 Tax=Nesterenkonia cremea TaxID=1882340 RepID=UPI00166A5EFE|nr:SDR family NAD(P)-dependent oxidoreductase [Nesterenkonia cremea]
MTVEFHGQTAIITGAGGGLGRAHALALAERGAHVVVNDMGGAEEVVQEIRSLGGSAVADSSDVTDPEAAGALAALALEHSGRIEILINNAGILRDKSFAKMDLSDFRKVLDVHLMGSVHCTQAVWPHMLEQRYGRLLMTTSASGIYGNFGQANYGAAKAAVVGLMNVLAIEGERKGIRVNALAPTAATQMTEDLLDAETLAALAPDTISPGALHLVSEHAPTKTILGAGAGVFAVSQMSESRGIYLPKAERTPEMVAARWEKITDMRETTVTGSAFDQTHRYTALAAQA